MLMKTAFRGMRLGTSPAFIGGPLLGPPAPFPAGFSWSRPINGLSVAISKGSRAAARCKGKPTSWGKWAPLRSCGTAPPPAGRAADRRASLGSTALDKLREQTEGTPRPTSRGPWGFLGPACSAAPQADPFLGEAGCIWGPSETPTLPSACPGAEGLPSHVRRPAHPVTAHAGHHAPGHPAGASSPFAGSFFLWAFGHDPRRQSAQPPPGPAPPSFRDPRIGSRGFLGVSGSDRLSVALGPGLSGSPHGGFLSRILLRARAWSGPDRAWAQGRATQGQN